MASAAREQRVGRAVGQRLRWGFGFLVLLMVGIGLSGWGTLSTVVTQLSGQLAGVQSTAVLASQLASAVGREMELGDQFTRTEDHTLASEYERVSDSAHMLQHVLAGRPGVPDEEIQLLARLDEQLADSRSVTRMLGCYTRLGVCLLLQLHMAWRRVMLCKCSIALIG